MCRKNIRWWRAWWLSLALGFLAGGICAGCGQSPGAGQDQEVVVAKVMDGDTVLLADGRKVRIAKRSGVEIDG